MNKLKEHLNNFYTKETCYSLYRQYLRDWIAEGYIGENLDIFKISMIDENSDKDFFINLIYEVYSNEEIFQKIFATLDPKVRKLFEIILLNREYKIEDNDINEYLLENKENILTLDIKFQFFSLKQSVNKKYIIYLDYEIVRVLRKYLEKVKNYYLYDASSEVESFSNLYKDNNEKEFLNNMLMYLDFSKSGLIKVSESGKILKDSKREMLKHCNITEYYGDLKNLEYLKTENICMFFAILSDEYKNEEYFNSANIKNIISDFIKTENINKKLHYPYTTLFLNYLKGIRNIWEQPENLAIVSTNLMNILAEIKEDYCISVKNIVKAFIFKEKDNELISFKDVKDYIYINEANYERKKIQRYEDYEDLVVEPFIKSYLFLLGTLGLLELFYTRPEKNSKVYVKNGYLSQFSGLKYIKLTNLGKYYFGHTAVYKAPTSYEKSEIFLDDKRLIVTILGESPTKRMFFEKISQKIGSNIYKITIDSFKRTLKSSASLNERIDNFKKNIGSENLPKNWQEFFDNLIKKYNSIEKINDFIVLKLKNDKELLNIIAKDMRFKELFLKAEDYHILVKKENLEDLIKIFKDYGYHFDLDI